MGKKSVIVLCVGIVLSFVACSFDKPEAPQWDLPLNIPLVDSTYTLSSFVGGIDDLVVSDYGLLGLKIDGTVDTTRVAPYRALEDIDYSYRINLDEFVIPVLPPMIEAYTFAQLSSQVGKEVQLFSTDFIRLRLYLNIVVNVNGD